jgi:hypothetical protein
MMHGLHQNRRNGSLLPRICTGTARVSALTPDCPLTATPVVADIFVRLYPGGRQYCLDA